MEIPWWELHVVLKEVSSKIIKIVTNLSCSDDLVWAEQICQRLEAKGFASTNIVLGVGSYSLGYATRDNQGGAIKSTYVEINGEGMEIFKDPVTDDGTKKSAKGLVGVYYDDYMNLNLYDQLTSKQEQEGELKTIFKNGKFVKTTTLAEIRTKINNYINK